MRPNIDGNVDWCGHHFWHQWERTVLVEWRHWMPDGVWGGIVRGEKTEAEHLNSPLRSLTEKRRWERAEAEGRIRAGKAWDKLYYLKYFAEIEQFWMTIIRNWALRINRPCKRTSVHEIIFLCLSLIGNWFSATTYLLVNCYTSFLIMLFKFS